jgi:hypothetical protein
MADEPVSRILYDANSSEPCAATIIPLAPASRPGSSDLPEGSSFRATRAAPEGARPLPRANSVSRASSPLLFGLAPRGVCRASGIAARAVGSYPTFSPLPAPRSIRRCPEGLPPGYHRDTLRRRSILCGTFRDATVSGYIPWRYQARCPTPPLQQPGFRPTTPFAKWCPDFPPADPSSTFRRTQDKPAIIQLTRHPYYNPRIP